MSQHEPEPPLPSSEAREFAVFLLQLAGIVLMVQGCIAVSLMLAVVLSPWLGMLAAAGGLWAWSRYGPRPFPGLLQGCVCVWGSTSLAGAFLLCLSLAIWASWLWLMG